MNYSKKHLLVFCILFLSSWQIMAQKYTLSGYISDSTSGEQLLGASVYISELKDGTASNLYGFYSITLPAGKYNVVYSYVGYKSKQLTINLSENTSLNMELGSVNVLNEVEITAERSNQIQEKTQMSTISISMDKVKTLPSFMGEQDVIKTLQLLPGVQSGGEGGSGLYVRGGGPDQNLILLDGVPVYNASHLFGFFSVFNADAINSVELMKGGFPARYGGRLSSVLDIRMKEGNLNEFHGEGSIGIISSKLSLEGPIIKGKTSFIVSGRRTYIDILSRPLIKAAAQQQGGSDVVAGYYFYDLNGKINHKFSDRSRLFLSAYTGDDKFYADIKEEYELDGKPNEDHVEADLTWGNKIAALRWNYMISPKLFSNATLTYSRYKFSTDAGYTQKTTNDQGDAVENSFLQTFYSGIDDITAKVDFDYMPSPNHFIKFGVGDIYHTFSPGASQTRLDFDEFELDSTIKSNTIYAHEAYAYIEDDFKIGHRLKINAGLYATAFNPKDTTFYSVQPRIAARFLIGQKASIKASYAEMMQPLHLLTNPTIGLPTDLWLPATTKVPVEYSRQIAVGFAQTIAEDYELSIEGYYKTMDNLIEYKDGQSFQVQDESWEEKVELGRGWSYGMELFFEKKVGKVSGWIGYTLSWTERQFDKINFGEVFPYKYDRRHDISFVLTYKPNEDWDIGVVWVYGTGNAYTLGLERYWQYTTQIHEFEGEIWLPEIEHVESRNNFRAPAYHRLDLGLNMHKETRWGQRTWSLGLYNAYSRQNPFYIYWGYSDGLISGNSNRELKQVALFPVIPSISYSFKF